MKTPRIVNAIGHIDDELISGTVKSKKKKKNHWARWGALAACSVVLVIAGATILPSLLAPNPDGSDNRYKDFNIQAGETALLWPWEYQTVYEKYANIEIDGIEYRGQGRTVSEARLDESIGTYNISAYDSNNNERHTVAATVHKLQDVAQNQFVAVKMDGAYYVFKNDEYAPPNTFGELLEAVNLPKLLELSRFRFSENDDDSDSKQFILNSDNYVWDILSGCRDAVFVDEQDWDTGNREYISFTITSETLGVYKVALDVTADGYLWTNAFDWQYLFKIGEDAAGKIIRYAKENSVKVEYEPYRNSIVGKLVEITEDYILIDDSILCRNPADGITYKVLLNDLRISRYVDYGVITVGDTVQISYEGKIDKENENTIDSAISASNIEL